MSKKVKIRAIGGSIIIVLAAKVVIEIKMKGYLSYLVKLPWNPPTQKNDHQNLRLY